MSKKPTKSRNPLTKRNLDNFTVMVIALASVLVGILIGMFSLEPASGEATSDEVGVEIDEASTLERYADDFFENSSLNWVEPDQVKTLVEPEQDSYVPIEFNAGQSDAERGDIVRNCTEGVIEIADNGLVSCEVAS